MAVYSIINHQDALALEGIVGSIFNNERWALSGLVNASYFELYPLAATDIILTYLYSTGKVVNNNEFEDFFSNSKTIFDYPDENLNPVTIKKYIDTLQSIVDTYCKDN